MRRNIRVLASLTFTTLATAIVGWHYYKRRVSKDAPDETEITVVIPTTKRGAALWRLIAVATDTPCQWLLDRIEGVSDNPTTKDAVLEELMEHVAQCDRCQVRDEDWLHEGNAFAPGLTNPGRSSSQHGSNGDSPFSNLPP